MCPGVPGTSPEWGLLTQEGGGAVTQRVFLVAGHAERRDGVESLGQEGLQARGAGVGRVEEVVDLLAGGTQLGHWGREGGSGLPSLRGEERGGDRDWARGLAGTGQRSRELNAQGGRTQDPVRGKAGEANPGHR